MLCLLHAGKGEDPPGLAHSRSSSPPAWERGVPAAQEPLLGSRQLCWVVGGGKASLSPLGCYWWEVCGLYVLSLDWAIQPLVD